jgi:hypothetical protein
MHLSPILVKLPIEQFFPILDELYIIAAGEITSLFLFLGIFFFFSSKEVEG